ncbi:MAG: DNA-3-methyladenine glycosylase 2 family protein [Clostridia bacterium]|nr:DNA-3-methyladenine glycosylase 2 family protein [Clostridia bacterium]
MLELKLNLKDTLTCGQMFRYEHQGQSYKIYSLDKWALCTQCGEIAKIETKDEEYFYNYFDGDTDYEEIHKALSFDETMSKLSNEYKGLRLLNQNFWEMLISFIISQNNNITRIQGIVERLCSNFGEEKENYFAFPTPEKLSECSLKDLEVLKCGYRDKYILDASRKYVNNEIDISAIKNGSTEQAISELCKILGIGLKVANCILLFGTSRKDVFPVDTWIEKAMINVYNLDGLSRAKMCEFGEKRFGIYSGYAQQYLFYGIRNGLI